MAVVRYTQATAKFERCSTAQAVPVVQRACVEWAETTTPQWVEDMLLPHTRLSSCTQGQGGPTSFSSAVLCRAFLHRRNLSCVRNGSSLDQVCRPLRPPQLQCPASLAPCSFLKASMRNPRRTLPYLAPATANTAKLQASRNAQAGVQKKPIRLLPKCKWSFPNTVSPLQN